MKANEPGKPGSPATDFTVAADSELVVRRFGHMRAVIDAYVWPSGVWRELRIEAQARLETELEANRQNAFPPTETS